MKAKNGNWKMISSLVNDILEDVVVDKDAIEEEEREEEAREEASSDEERDLSGPLSAYEKLRNKRIREIQAEFNSKFPNFEEEVKQLKVRKKRRNRGGRKTFPEVSNPKRSLRGLRGSGQQQIVSFQTDARVQDQSSSPQDHGLIIDQV